MKYLVTIDFASERLEEYLRFVFSLLNEEDVVYILTVIQEVTSIIQGNEVYVNYNKNVEATAKKNLSAVGKQFTARNIKHTLVLSKGDVGESIIIHAEKFDVDLVVLGRRRDLGLVNKLLSGSTSNYVASNLNRSVFIF